MAEWTDEQRRLLVECAYHATEVTGHDLRECLTELHELVKAYKDGRIGDRGVVNDNQQA